MNPTSKTWLALFSLLTLNFFLFLSPLLVQARYIGADPPKR